MILCVGALGAGKSTLLRVLHTHGLDDGAAAMSPDFVIPTTTPTVGTDILSLSKGNSKGGGGGGVPEEKAVVREVGGAMAPIWSSFVEPGKTHAILYVVDASSPETIAAATIHLVELLAHPSLDGISVMIVFSKADLRCARQLHEMKNLMRLEQIIGGGSHDIQEVTFDISKRDTTAQIFDWCMKFQSVQEGPSSTL